jgi:hypothetical protein
VRTDKTPPEAIAIVTARGSHVNAVGSMRRIASVPEAIVGDGVKNVYERGFLYWTLNALDRSSVSRTQQSQEITVCHFRWDCWEIPAHSAAGRLDDSQKCDSCSCGTTK